MKKDIFRKESIEQINSPRDLTDYIREIKPGVFIIITAIIIMLLGALAWCILGEVNTGTEVIHPITFIIN